LELTARSHGRSTDAANAPNNARQIHKQSFVAGRMY